MVKQAILYRRFSDSAQSTGDSLRRQSKLANEWCEKNNARIIDVQTDAGVSGFRGKHSANGALSVVIKAIENGDINEGTYLLIENLDRLSREEIATAQARITDILSHGVNIVTLQDGKIFTKESLNDMGDIIWMIVAMARANEESQTKSNRVSRSWEAKRELIESGKKPKVRAPSWITYNDETEDYELNEEAEIVQKVFDVYLEQLSMSATAKFLNDIEIKPIGYAKKWGQTSIRHLLTNKSVYGVLDAKTIKYDDFYPAAVDKDKFYLVQAELKRNSAPSKEHSSNGKTSNLLSGLGKCGICGSTLVMHGKIRLSAGGQMEDYRYLSCSAKRYANTSNKCHLPNFRYKYVEGIVATIATHLESLPKDEKSESKKGFLKGKIDALTAEMNELIVKQKNAADMMFEFADDEIFKERYGLIRKSVAEKEAQIQEMNEELSVIISINDDKGFYERIAEVASKLKGDEYRLRFMATLNRIITDCTFNEDGSVTFVIFNNEILIRKVAKQSVIEINGRSHILKF